MNFAPYFDAFDASDWLPTLALAIILVIFVITILRDDSWFMDLLRADMCREMPPRPPLPPPQVQMSPIGMITRCDPPPPEPPRPGMILTRVKGRETWIPAPPPIPPARTVKGDRLPDDLQQRPQRRCAPPAQRGDTVMVKGMRSNGLDTHPAVITRLFTPDQANVTLLPDGALPLPMQSVRLFPSQAEAEAYLQSLNGASDIVAWQRSNTDTDSLK
jgi:hypothetical protein